jgi:hypothetical protein
MYHPSSFKGHHQPTGVSIRALLGFRVHKAIIQGPSEQHTNWHMGLPHIKQSAYSRTESGRAVQFFYF